ncbi:STAS domain-containing protein [Cellulomonas sp. Sa3CUA2]|uniref:STAS domain-containing protein n=1 Tax=Cellulomonas avistercoris TaxID=2762242 RepID=A0ABR8QAF9_9CELL|nr:STAS domain-containing protein [Cellulomonas avistercoris]MBD7917402.1 STAS domain-containing protein [Cellulomonas avistercoris]
MPGSTPFSDPTSGSITTRVTTGADGRTLVVRLVGEIDVALQQQADAAMARVVELRLPVALDLADVSLLGATGLTFIARCEHSCADAGVRCVVQHVTPNVARVLTALGLDAVLRRVEPGPVVAS